MIFKRLLHCAPQAVEQANSPWQVQLLCCVHAYSLGTQAPPPRPWQARQVPRPLKHALLSVLINTFSIDYNGSPEQRRQAQDWSAAVVLCQGLAARAWGRGPAVHTRRLAQRSQAPAAAMHSLKGRVYC